MVRTTVIQLTYDTGHKINYVYPRIYHYCTLVRRFLSNVLLLSTIPFCSRGLINSFPFIFYRIGELFSREINHFAPGFNIGISRGSDRCYDKSDDKCVNKRLVGIYYGWLFSCDNSRKINTAITILWASNKFAKLDIKCGDNRRHYNDKSSYVQLLGCWTGFFQI